MRMAVYAGWRSVSSPSSVSNGGVGVEDLVQVEVGLVDQLLQGGNLADLLDRIHLVLLVAVNGKTGGVIATVF